MNIHLTFFYNDLLIKLFLDIYSEEKNNYINITRKLPFTILGVGDKLKVYQQSLMSKKMILSDQRQGSKWGKFG